MSATLLLVRHGETASNRKRVYMGRSEEPLSRRGREQARSVAGRLSVSGYGFKKILASPVARAHETALIIGKRCRVPVGKAGYLTEIDFGPWCGLTAVEIEERYPGDWKLWRGSPHRLRLRGMETLSRVRRRVREGLSADLRAGPGSGIVLVTHDVVIRAILALTLGIDDSHYRSFTVDNASLSVVIWGKEKRRLALLNATDHLRR